MTTNPTPRNSLRGAPWQVHAFSWGVFGIITLVLLALYTAYRDTDVWYLWAGDQLKARGTFAELVRASIFRTRANTWSNLGFIFVGLYIVAYAWWDARRETLQQDPYAVRQPALMGFFGLACIVLGFGSGAMHAALMGWGHKADVYGMYISIGSLVALQWARWAPTHLGKRRAPTWPLFAITAIIASVLLLANMKTLRGDYVTMALIALVVVNASIDVFSRRTSLQLRWLFASYVAMTVAYYIWRLDMARVFSTPETWFQGHAIWHLLNAVSLGSLAILYRSELPRRAPAEAVGAGATPLRAAPLPQE